MIQGNSYLIIVDIAVAFAVAAIAVSVLRRVIRRVIGALDAASPENRAALHAREQQLVRAVTVLAYGIAALVTLSLGLERFGVEEAPWHPRQIVHWVLTHGVNMTLIVVIAYVVVRAAHLGIDHLQHNLQRRHGDSDFEWQRRASTLSRMLTRLVTIAAGFVAVMMLLRELSIDAVPILTGAGIAGLAVGFGAQNLVRDVISGFFIILEDQVRIGDVARINGVTGTVEEISLRTIILRDNEGAVQVFPNGTIAALANLSKQFSYAVVDVRAAYQENIDRVFGTIREVGAAMEGDPAWAGAVLAPLEVTGVESIADGFATIRVRFKTAPLNQGRVANELRKRLVTTLAGRGIRPYAGP